MTAAPKIQNTKTLLLIDDESEIRAHMTELLAHSYGDSLLVLQAEGGDSAIEILKSSSVDFIVCDFNMDNGSGLTVYAHLQQRQEKNVQFVFFSASKNLESLLPPLEGSFHGVVGKPNFEAVVQLIGKWLRR